MLDGASFVLGIRYGNLVCVVLAELFSPKNLTITFASPFLFVHIIYVLNGLGEMIIRNQRQLLELVYVGLKVVYVGICVAIGHIGIGTSKNSGIGNEVVCQVRKRHDEMSGKDYRGLLNSEKKKTSLISSFFELEHGREQVR